MNAYASAGCHSIRMIRMSYGVTPNDPHLAFITKLLVAFVLSELGAYGPQNVAPVVGSAHHVMWLCSTLQVQICGTALGASVEKHVCRGAHLWEDCMQGVHP